MFTITKYSILLLVLTFLLRPTLQQTHLFWAIPSDNYQSNSISIIIQGYAQTYFTNITFTSIFATSPYVMLSLSSLESINYNSQINQQAITRTTLIFIHKLTLNDPKYSIRLLRISYTAFSLAKFYYLKPHSMTLSLKYLSISNNPDTQYTQVNYIEPLEPDRQYVIGILLSGFKIQCNTTSLMLAIDAQLYTLSSYLVKVTINNGYALQIQYTRVLIDKTVQAAQPSGLGVLYIYHGVITHNIDNYTIVQPQQTRVQGIALTGQFYGIKQFTTSFNCVTNNSVFKTPKTPVNMKTTVILFIQYQCPGSHLYVSAVKLCYYRYFPRIYRIGLKQAGFCFQACYTCIGPNYTDCKSYLPMQANKNAGHITCLSNYSTNPLTGRCRSCISYVQNCNSCTSDGQCLTCLPGCNLINATYCDCSSICPYPNQIISPRDGTCICKPQYYRLPNNTCAACAQKCYLCTDNPVNCMACSDPYQLEFSSCINFQQSTYFQNSDPGAALNEQRCTQYIGSGTCVYFCPLTSYLVKKLCYPFECPAGSFPFQDIHDNKKMCQKCPDPCIDCDNYFICKKCRDGQFFLDQSGVCRGCSTGCGNCTNHTTCLVCNSGYEIIYYTNQQNQTFSKCKQILPPAPLSCPTGCRQCVIQQYCQVCAVGFYRFGNNMQCDPCTGQGALLNKYALIQDVVQLQCTEICGDGYLYVDECDDGNVDNGDGCNSKCQIQDGYRCEYLIGIRQSICDKIGADKRMTCKYSKNLTKNSLNISIHWRFNSSLQFNTICQNKMKPASINSYHTNQTFTFDYNQSIQNITCKFYIPQSIYFTQIISCNITSQPYSLYYPESIILNIAQFVFSYISKPIFYIILLFCVIGIEPYEILINYSTIILYLASLYQFQSQPSSVYGIFAGLKIFAFDWDNMANDQKLDKDGFRFFQPCYLMLIFLAVVVVFQQTIVRCLSKYCYVIKQIFQKRWILYLVIYTSMQPIITIYISSIFVQGFIHNMEPPIIISFIHIFFMIVSCIILCCMNEKITDPKGGQKFYIYIIVIKVFSAISPLFIVYFSDNLSILIVIIGVGMIILTPYTVFNEQMDIEDYYQQTSNWLMQQQDKRELGKNWGKAKAIVRKANFSVQLGVLAIIFVLRFVFMTSHQFHFDNNYVNIGAIITIIFVICSLGIGCILNIMSQLITLIIYYKVSKQQQIDENIFNSRQNNSNQNIQEQQMQQQQRDYQYVK